MKLPQQVRSQVQLGNEGNIKSGTQAGAVLRLRGLGLPKDDAKRGDLYATVSIEIPPSVTDDEKKMWEQLAAKSKFEPRS
jgi:curved DNA-binding protein